MAANGEESDCRRLCNLMIESNAEARESRKVMERGVEAMQRSARAAEDIASRENTTLHGMRTELTTMNKQLALVIDNSKDAERAAQHASAQAVATREVTGSFRTQQPQAESKSGKFAAIAKAALKARAGTLLALAGLFVAAGLALGAGVAVYEYTKRMLGAH